VTVNNVTCFVIETRISTYLITGQNVDKLIQNYNHVKLPIRIYIHYSHNFVPVRRYCTFTIIVIFAQAGRIQK